MVIKYNCNDTNKFCRLLKRFFWKILLLFQNIIFSNIKLNILHYFWHNF